MRETFDQLYLEKKQAGETGKQEHIPLKNKNNNWNWAGNVILKLYKKQTKQEKVDLALMIFRHPRGLKSSELKLNQCDWGGKDSALQQVIFLKREQSVNLVTVGGVGTGKAFRQINTVCFHMINHEIFTVGLLI